MLYVFSYIYLAIPLLIFFITWLRLPYAVILAAALLYPGLRLMRESGQKKISLYPSTRWILPIILAFIWTYFSGAGAFVFQNSDWVKHNAILHDLVRYDWPVQYNTYDVPAFLNYYLGWYIAPALIGKLAGMQAALLTQFIYTFFGVLVSFAWLAKIIKKPSLFLFIFFILFATADALGLILVRNFTLFNFITPLERWTATPHEYSSFTTLMFWVPGQAIGLWIVMGAFIDMIKKEKTTHLPILASLLMFWSPLGFIGMLPFTGFAMWRHKKNSAIIGSSILLLIFFYLYYASNIFGILHAKEYIGLWVADARIFWLRFIIFIFSEAFVPTALIFSLRKHLDERLRKLFYIATPVLLILPFFTYGIVNDLVMRASIPSLFIMFVCSYTLLISRMVRTRHGILWLLLILYFMLGAVTSMTELNRAMQSKPNYDTPKSLEDIGDPLAVKQYLGFKESFLGRKMLKNANH